MSFTLPELSTSKIITWAYHIVDSKTLHKNAQCDMIIGADLFSEFQSINLLCISILNTIYSLSKNGYL
jgi:hypothetical protein